MMKCRTEVQTTVHVHEIWYVGPTVVGADKVGTTVQFSEARSQVHSRA